MLLKLLFNIFVIYAIWQIIKMMMAVNKTQQKFHQKMDEMKQDMDSGKNSSKKDKGDGDGEYIDYEELK